MCGSIQDPDYIEVEFRVAKDGVIIDANDNYHSSFADAIRYYNEKLIHVPGTSYSIVEIATVRTIHDIEDV
jgi:hypothetical protein